MFDVLQAKYAETVDYYLFSKPYTLCMRWIPIESCENTLFFSPNPDNLFILENIGFCYHFFPQTQTGFVTIGYLWDGKQVSHSRSFVTKKSKPRNSLFLKDLNGGTLCV